ncbi:molybdate transport system permease protein [Balnearium lithotrophicum]|uniref:Molybdenum transport system permease n=1 Tax=Balnearium lithotrophicum TaxID=223788 RepID=A0A521AEF8_9BACT|nr:molybdate ABC transporter permease subunit [Balnearium lithotrophicum]SMO33156.1 molybdate transport system permease protein [Balnearium lithotrophicum]
MVLDPEALFSIKLSMKVASLSTLLVFTFGLPLSYIFATKEFPLKNLLDALMTLPVVLTPTVTGYILLLIFGKNGIVGKFIYELFKTGIVFTWYGAVLASFVVSFPLFVKSARASIESVDRNLIYASYTLGKSGLETFFKVVLPLAKEGIIAGIVLSFARALGEFGATLMIAGNIPFRTNTIPIEIYDAVSSGDFEKANVLTLIVTLISVTVIFVINRLSKKVNWRSNV